MNNILKQTGGIVLFWVLFFIIGRIYFLGYNYALWTDGSWLEFFQLFFRALYMDAAVIAMFLAPTFLISLIQFFSAAKGWYYLQMFYQGSLILLVSIIHMSEPPLYYEWRTKLSQKALDHMWNSPDEVFKTATLSSQVVGYLALAVMLVLAFYLMRKLVPYRNLKSATWVSKGIYFLIMPAFIVIGMRGGVQPIAISQGDIYFSKKTQIFNAAAVNAVWNIGHSYEHNSRNGLNNPFKVMAASEAKALLNQAFAVEKDSSISILNTTQPNIIFIILESWSADMVAKLGGYEGVAPQFNAWTDKGLLFTKFIASGERSEQGMACIYSAFPSQPHTSIFGIQAKSQNLPFLTHPFDQKGYVSSYTFGGDLSYGNISSYMYQHKMQRIVEQSDFSSSIPAGRLGIHDGYVFDRFYQDINKEQGPFFASIFTLSSHAPYDMPMEEKIDFGGDEKGYLNSVYYADSALGDFLSKAEQEDWYDNTLIVIMADHSHVTPKNHNYFSWKHHHIPVLFTGGALKDSMRGQTYDHWANHQDLAKTILKQVHEDSAANQYFYSRDLFNPVHPPQFAYYTFNNGSGLISDSAHVSYNFNTQQWHFEEFAPSWSDSLKNKYKNFSQAYLQQVFQDYLDMDQLK